MAVIAVDRVGNLLLSATTQIEVTAFGHLPWPLARSEYAAQLLTECLGITAHLVSLAPLAPTPEISGARVSVSLACFSQAMLAALATTRLGIVHFSALPALSDLHGPVLRLILAANILQPVLAKFA